MVIEYIFLVICYVVASDTMAQDPSLSPRAFSSFPSSAVAGLISQPDPAWPWTLPTRPTQRSWSSSSRSCPQGGVLCLGLKLLLLSAICLLLVIPMGTPPVLESPRPQEPSASSVPCHTPGFRKIPKLSQVLSVGQGTFPPLLPALGYP